jgi:hypothetical protein
MHTLKRGNRVQDIHTTKNPQKVHKKLGFSRKIKKQKNRAVQIDTVTKHAP